MRVIADSCSTWRGKWPIVGPLKPNELVRVQRVHPAFVAVARVSPTTVAAEHVRFRKIIEICFRLHESGTSWADFPWPRVRVLFFSSNQQLPDAAIPGTCSESH